MPSKSGIFFRSLGQFIAALLRSFSLFFPGFLFVVLYYLIIIVMPIGQDMLMQSGEYAGAIFWTTVSIILWTFVAWYSSRLVSYRNHEGNKYDRLFRKHLPRWIGYNVPVSFQIAVLHLPTVANINLGFSITIFLFNTLLYCLFFIAMRRKKIYAILLSISLAIGLFIYPHLLSTDNTIWHVKVLKLMLSGLFLFQVFFLWFVNWRRKKIDNFTTGQVRTWKKIYMAVAAASVITFLIITFSPAFAYNFGALGCITIAFTVWVGFIYLIRHLSAWLNVRLALPLLVSAIIIGYFLNPYNVQLAKTSVINLYEQRPSIDSFLHRWLTDPCRSKQIAEGKYTTYLVIADGGASKSGYWVASVLSKLQQESRAKNDPLSNHILSLAGASGGSVGNAAFYSMLLAAKNGNFKGFETETDTFFRGDFLTFTLARYLGSDLFRHLFPVKAVYDRAAALELSMEELSESRVISKTFSKTLDLVFDQSGQLPLLFINTTNLESGSPGLISNIKFDSTLSERIDVLKLVDKEGRQDTSNGNTDLDGNIKLSTAVVLGARFPYVSPAGDIGGKYFVDGGYFDNSGSGITIELLNYINRILRDSSDHKLRPLLEKLNFRVIYISNGSLPGNKKTFLHPLINDIAAPLLTLGNTYSMQTGMSNDRLDKLIRDMGDSTYVLNLPMPERKDTVPYPMNWVISDYNLDRIKQNLDSVSLKKIGIK